MLSDAFITVTLTHDWGPLVPKSEVRFQQMPRVPKLKQLQSLPLPRFEHKIREEKVSLSDDFFDGFCAENYLLLFFPVAVCFDDMFVFVGIEIVCFRARTDD